MKKRLFAMLLTLLMIFSTSSTIFATDINVSFDTFYEWAIKISEKMPSDKTEAVKIYNIISTYLKTDTGIQTLIDIVEGKNDFSSNNDLKKIFGLFEDYEDFSYELSFILRLGKSIPAQNRKNAIEKFTDKNVNGSLAKNIKGESLKSLNKIYDNFVPENYRDKLKDDFGLEAIHIAILLEALNGNIKLTDDKAGDSLFTIKSVDGKFRSNLTNNLKGFYINGKEIKNGQDVLDAFLKELNSNRSSLAKYRLDIKKVLEKMNLYEKKETSKPKDPVSGGSSGTRVVYTEPPKPEQEQGQEQVKPNFNITPPNNTSVVYKDTQEHWAKNYIGLMSEKSIFKGYEDDSFRPESNITRQETAVVIVRMLGLEGNLDENLDVSFADKDKIAPWALSSIAYLSRLGVMGGYAEDNSVRPDNTITREEFITMVTRIVNVTAPTDNAINFTDNDQISSWAQNNIKNAINLGLIKGYEDNSFRPKNPITRAEASVVFYNYMFIEGNLK